MPKPSRRQLRKHLDLIFRRMFDQNPREVQDQLSWRDSKKGLCREISMDGEPVSKLYYNDDMQLTFEFLPRSTAGGVDA